MKKTFRRWLMLFMAAAFVISVAISFVAQTNMAANNANELINRRIVDIRLRIDDYVNRSARTRTILDNNALVTARAVARCVQGDQSLLTDQQRLQQLADSLNVDEACVTDSNGIIIASVPVSNIGFDMKSSAQSSAFMGAINYPDFKYVQSFQDKGLGDGTKVKYAGVARLDEPGIVQVGLYDSRVQNTLGIVNLNTVVEGLAVGDEGQAFVSDGETILSATNPDYEDKSLSEFGLDTTSLLKTSSSSIFDINGKQYRVQAESYKNYIIVAMLPTSEIYLSRNASLMGLTAFIALLFGIVFLLVDALVQRLVINGIFSVNRSLTKIEEGDLDEKVEVRNSPEFETLSDGINSTVGSLKQHIAAEASRIDADLALAKAIQLGSLQTVFPAFPGHDEFDLYAHMTPAREVGGDFYDMFMPDEEHLICVMADVSGKGIPAAMFMMEAKSYINSLVLATSSLPKVFEQANDKLCKENDAGLFVTAFIINLDLDSGDFEFVNAGHNPPVICHIDGQCEYLSCKPGFVLGGIEGISYASGNGHLDPEECFIAYTDGVTEALDEDDEFYGEERLLNLLAKQTDIDVKETVDMLEKDLADFRGQAEQADDITILALKYRKAHEATFADGHEEGTHVSMVTHRMETKARMTSFDGVMGFLKSEMDYNGCPAEVVSRICLAIEEVFVNIASYAYDEEDVRQDSDTVEISCTTDYEKREVSITFTDHGVQYDPLGRPDPDITAGAEERAIGGLGVYLVKQIMDEVSYSYDGHNNKLSMKKGWDA